MPQERNVLTERFWTVRVIRDFWYKGVWRQTGEQIHMPPHVARGQIEAGNVLQVNWPKATTDIPWALQSVGPQSGGGGVAGVGSINGIDGDINILAGPNITVTTGASSITIGAPNVVPTSRQIIAGAGLSGGGALTGNVTLTANVQSVFGRTGAITAQAGDYNASQITISPAISGWTTVQQAITALSTISGAPAGANGQIQFNNSGAFGASANLYWSNTTGRLGIGTASPAYALDVNGDINLTTGTGSYRVNGTPGLWGTFDVIGPGGVLTEWEFEGGILTSYEEKSGTPLGLVIVSPTAPPSPPVGQLWWDTTNLRLMIWNGVWIQAG